MSEGREGYPREGGYPRESYSRESYTRDPPQEGAMARKSYPGEGNLYVPQPGMMANVTIAVSSSSQAIPLASTARNPPLYSTPPSGDLAHRSISPAHRQNLVDALKQKESEIHLLRMNVTDKEVRIGKLNRDLDHCHHQMKHLNTLLTEKKESVLSYQDKITNMRAELAELRDYAITSGRRQEAQDPAHSSTPAERALQVQVEQLSRQNSDLHQQLAVERRRGGGMTLTSSEASRSRTTPYQAAVGRGGQAEMDAQHDQARMEHGSVGRQNQDLLTTVETLQVQVSVYAEDFKNEREDRQRAQAELHELKQERDCLREAINLMATENGLPLPPNN